MTDSSQFSSYTPLVIDHPIIDVLPLFSISFAINFEKHSHILPITHAPITYTNRIGSYSAYYYNDHSTFREDIYRVSFLDSEPNTKFSVYTGKPDNLELTIVRFSLLSLLYFFTPAPRSPIFLAKTNIYRFKSYPYNNDVTFIVPFTVSSLNMAKVQNEKKHTIDTAKAKLTKLGISENILSQLLESKIHALFLPFFLVGTQPYMLAYFIFNGYGPYFIDLNFGNFTGLFDVHSAIEFGLDIVSLSNYGSYKPKKRHHRDYMDTLGIEKGKAVPFIYTPKSHGGKTLDEAIIDLNEKYKVFRNTGDMNVKLDELKKLIPVHALQGRTVLDVINQSIATVKTSLESTITDKSTFIRKENATEVKQVRDDIRVYKENNEKEIITISDIQKTTLDKVYDVQDRLRNCDNAIHKIQNAPKGPTLEAFQRLELNLSEMSNEIPTSVDMQKDLQHYVDKIFSTGRFSRRVGYYNTPPAGIFNSPFIMISNEGNIIKVDFQNSIIHKINAPTSLLDNYTLHIKTITKKQGVIAFISKSEVLQNVNMYTKVDTFKSKISNICYAYFDAFTKIDQNFVLYLTYGRPMYV